MKRYRFVWIAVLVSLSTVWGESPPSNATTDDTPTIAETVAKMSVEERVAQVMLVSLHGMQAANYAERDFLSRYWPGGVLLTEAFDASSLPPYIQTLRAPSVAGDRTPLLIGTNLYALSQGKQVIGTSFVQLPSQLAIGATGRSDAAEQVAGVLAEYESTLGFNLNLGPTLALSPMISMGNRTEDTFGGDAAFAAVAGETMVRTLLDRKVLPVVMDFPGIPIGTDERAPDVLVTSSEVLHQRYLVPYAAAIRAGTPFVHISNGLVPGIDEDSRPACLSKAVIQDLLRGELMYRGVVMAGPMDARALARIENPIEASIDALNAGADVLMWQSEVPVVMRVIPALVKAVEDGRLPEARLNDAVSRILALKEQYGLRALPMPDENAARRLERSKKPETAARTIERQAITLVKDDKQVLPLTKGGSLPVGVTGIFGVHELFEPLQKKLKSVMEQPMSTAKHTGDIADFEIYRATNDAKGLRTAVCILGPTVRLRGQLELISAFKLKGARVVVVYFGHPADVPKLADADAILLAYGDSTPNAETLEAVKDVLLGEAPAGFAPPASPLTVTAGAAHAFKASEFLHVPAGRLPLDLGGNFQEGKWASYNLDGAIKKAVWEFGDGATEKGLDVQHTYTAPGQYTATLTATDATGSTVSGSIPVSVE